MWILEGTCHNPGHPWKDGYTRGQKVFAYSWTLPPPYASGQHPRVGGTIASVTQDHFSFRLCGPLTVARLLPLMLRDLRSWWLWRKVRTMEG